MLSKTKDLNILLMISMICYFIMCADFLIIPIGGNNFAQSHQWFNIITGLIFWLGLIGGAVSFIKYSKKCKELCDKNSVKKDICKNKKTGLVTFFSNRISKVADIVFIASVVLFAALMIFTDRTSYFCYVSIFILIFSLVMHCVFNGKMFCIHLNLIKSPNK